MSDTITLVAGILLTSVGLLALLPFVLRLGRRSTSEVLQIDDSFLPALAAADALMRPDAPLTPAPAIEEPSRVNDDVEELMAHLFGLRMTISELTAEVQAVQDVLAGDSAEDHEALPEDEAAAADEVPASRAIRHVA